jgi:hypothetical protein
LTLPGVGDRDYLLEWRNHAAGSPFYQELVGITANDPDLLKVIGRIHRQPPPNVFLAAIQFLLFKDPQATLAGYYASLTDDPLPMDNVATPFRDFVLEHRSEIVQIANSRYTQTNESRRCVALLPGVMSSPFPAFHLVDVGTSIGLNLALDRYNYDFSGLRWGPDSTVTLKTDVRGEMPNLRDFDVLSRTGIDINVLNPSEPDDRMWLEALIWPEHHERRVRLRDSIGIVSDLDSQLIEGDVLDILEPALDQISDDAPVVILNSFVLNQLDLEQRDSYAAAIDTARAKRPIYRVSLEITRKGDPRASLEVGDESQLFELGAAHAHGEWIDLRY